MIRWDAGPTTGAQCSGPTRAAMHHGAKNSACKNTPPVKCTTLNTSDNASIRTYLPGSGVLVMSLGGLIIDPRPPADLKIAPSARRLVAAVGTPLSRMETEHECDQQDPAQRAIRALHSIIQASALG